MRERVVAFGERALLVELGESFDEALVARARAVADAWEVEGHGPALPTYAATLLRFDPLVLGPAEAERAAREIVSRTEGATALGESGRTVEIPVRYDGPDLADTAARSGVSPDELVALHSAREYRAYFLGFLPGFAYCGRLDPRIIAPRLERPRTHVRAGSVAIADGQTAVYPVASPGGWRLIGSTGLAVFDASSPEAFRIRAGDRIRFVPR